MDVGSTRASERLVRAKRTRRALLVREDPVEWAAEHMRTERGGRLDFDRHPYLVAPLRDPSPRKGLMCAGQVGKTTLAMSDVLHFCDCLQVRVIYTMHTDGVGRLR